MHGRYESDDKDISDGASTQRWFQSNRYRFGIIIGMVLCGGVLLLPILQELPFGADWIGFAVLASQITENGNMILTGVNEGSADIPQHFPLWQVG